MRNILTIGHSNHPIKDFVGLLRQHCVGVVMDVRSSPYSRLHPQFNREPLAAQLSKARIDYRFLGDKLGARPDDAGCYLDGRVRYDRLAKTTAFQDGLRQVIESHLSMQIALMCAERDPLDCHRTILVARHLHDAAIPVVHVLAGGELESHEKTIERLLRTVGRAGEELFRSREEVIDEAFSMREAEIAYSTADAASATAVQP